jgi:CMP-N-acetylneuraminic acid synthetase
MNKDFQLQYQVLIPARGGSKRFPGKNIVDLASIPLIEHSVNYALQVFPKKNIWVNSDDDEILNLVKKYDINIVKRPDNLADDFTPIVEVCQFQVNEFRLQSVLCDALILLQPTNPLRPKDLLYNAISEFELFNRNSLATFTSLNRKLGHIRNNYFYPSNYNPGQRMQDIQSDYFENGLLYISRVESIEKGHIITEDVLPYIVDDIYAHVDIDLPDDLLFAEFLLRR